MLATVLMLVSLILGRDALAYYSPQAGCWPNRDPIQEKGSINLYAFNANNPINKFDLFGLITPGGSDPFDPSMLGKPCSCLCQRRPCNFNGPITLKDSGSEPGTFRIKADYPAPMRSGCCPQWQLRWTSCIRSGHPMGGGDTRMQ
jgi:hypothetical protein